MSDHGDHVENNSKNPRLEPTSYVENENNEKRSCTQINRKN
jgi:hypothetical protein